MRLEGSPKERGRSLAAALEREARARAGERFGSGLTEAVIQVLERQFAVTGRLKGQAARDGRGDAAYCLRAPALLTKLELLDRIAPVPRLRTYAESAAAEIESRSRAYA